MGNKLPLHYSVRIARNSSTDFFVRCIRLSILVQIGFGNYFHFQNGSLSPQQGKENKRRGEKKSVNILIYLGPTEI